MEGGELGPAGGACCGVGNVDYQSSVTAGTIFQDTRLPLRTWFRTMWWVTSQTYGAEPHWDCKAAWVWEATVPPGRCCIKLRRAMVRPGRVRLSGRVEVDETYVGGAEDGLRGRQTRKKHW